MADNGLLDAGVARTIERTKGVKKGVRARNWLLKEQATELLNAPDPSTLKGKRDRAILSLLICCGLHRAELLRLDMAQIRLREGRWVIVDLDGNRNRLRTVTVPTGVRVRIEEWIVAAKILEGRVFRPVNRGGQVTGEAIADEKTVLEVVLQYAEAISLPNSSIYTLRRTCAKLCREAGWDLEQIQRLLGHASAQTTARYAGKEENLSIAANDLLDVG